MEILKELLGPTPLSDFLEKHFTRLPFSSLGGAKNHLSLLTWETVRTVMEEKKSVLRIVQDGRVIKDHIELSFEEAKEHHRQGHTLLLRYAEKSHPDLQRLARDFERSFHTDVDIQLYCTPEGHNAFGWHYDVEEVFILQTQGSKHYTIRPNTVHPHPLISSIPKDLGYEKEKTPLEVQVTLEAGDWLYIPSGWWHVAKTKSESMHISIGLMPVSAIDPVKFLPRYLSQFSFWRTRLPIHKTFSSPEEEHEFYQEAMAKLGKELEKKMSSKEFISEFIEYMKNLKSEKKSGQDR